MLIVNSRFDMLSNTPRIKFGEYVSADIWISHVFVHDDMVLRIPVVIPSAWMKIYIPTKREFVIDIGASNLYNNSGFMSELAMYYTHILSSIAQNILDIIQARGNKEWIQFNISLLHFIIGH